MKCAFDVEHYSRAWVGRPGVPKPTHNGTLIMPNGDILNYDLSQLDHTENSIYTKIKHSNKVGQLQQITMNKFCFLFSQIDKKENIKLSPTVFDLGSFNFIGYKLLSNGIWKQIELGSWGDPTSLHPNPTAKFIINHLSAIIGKDIFFA